MAGKTSLFLVLGAVAILGQVHGVHREELPAAPYPVAWQHQQRVVVEVAETKSNASSQTSRRSSMPRRIAKWPDSGSRNGTGRGAGSSRVDGPQHSESVADPQDATPAQHNDTIAHGYASSHGLNISSPTSESDAVHEAKDEVNIGAESSGLNVSGVGGWDDAASENEVKEEIQDRTHNASMPSPGATVETIGEAETKDEIREEIREHNASGVIRQEGEPDGSEVKAEIHDQSHKPNLSSLNSEIGRRYADDAMGAVSNAVKAAAEHDREAAKGMVQANATFRKAEDAQAKADAALKGALDAEAQLIDAKAAALRNITAAQEVMVAATKANMDANEDSSSSPLVLQREKRTAEEAVLRAKHGFNAVRGKLSGAERASVAAQQTAAQAAHKTLVAHHDFEAAKGLAATAAANRARVEEQAAQASAGIVRASEAFDRASKAKDEAWQSFKAAKQELVDAAHVAVVMTQKAGNGTSQMPST